MFSEFFVFVCCLFFYPFISVGVVLTAFWLYRFLETKRLPYFDLPLQRLGLVVLVIAGSLFWLANGATSGWWQIPTVAIFLGYFSQGAYYVYRHRGVWQDAVERAAQFDL